MSFCLDAKYDQHVEKDLSQITKHILELKLPVLALILSGSFGRGEGIVKVIDKNIISQNDYDIIVVTNNRLNFSARKKLRAAQDKLAQIINIRHLDLINLSTKDLQQNSVKMLLYDLKFHSQVFWQNDKGVTENILDLIPYKKESPIPDLEILNLLINRMLSLLEAHPQTKSLDSKELKARQIAKVRYALVDYCLIQANCYQTLYKEKENYLQTLSTPLAQILSKDLGWINQARTLQLEQIEISNIWATTRQLLVEAISNLSAKILGQNQTSYEQVLENWRFPKSNLIIYFRKLVSALKGKIDHQKVEKEIFKLLFEYDSSSAFAKKADTLIAQWYDS